MVSYIRVGDRIIYKPSIRSKFELHFSDIQFKT